MVRLGGSIGCWKHGRVCWLGFSRRAATTGSASARQRLRKSNSFATRFAMCGRAARCGVSRPNKRGRSSNAWRRKCNGCEWSWRRRPRRLEKKSLRPADRTDARSPATLFAGTNPVLTAAPVVAGPHGISGGQSRGRVGRAVLGDRVGGAGAHHGTDLALANHVVSARTSEGTG